MLLWVGLARTPWLFNNKQSCHAVLPLTLFFSSMTTAFNKPRPRTHSTNGEFKARIPERKTSPNLMARSANFSSTRTSRAVIATAHPSGLLERLQSKRELDHEQTHPPYVLPCSPGLIHNMISRSAKTAETGYTADYQLLMTPFTQ